MLSLQSASMIAGWLETNYLKYLYVLQTGGEPVKYIGKRSGNWDSGTRLRVSKVASDCPKLSACVQRDLIKPIEHTINDYVRFEDATRVAEEVYESIAWSCLHNQDFSFRAETRVYEHPTGLVGTPDGVLSFNDIQLPIEVKRTDCDVRHTKPNGISVEHMLQVIGEMILLGNGELGDVKFGYLFARYSFDSDMLVRAWTIAHEVDDNGAPGWRLYYKMQQQSAGNDTWPVDSTGAIWITEDFYRARWRQHQEYMTLPAPVEAPGPYRWGENWHCGKIVKPEFYAENGKYHGGQKPNTGYVSVKCPLFEKCFAAEVQAGGYDPQERRLRYRIGSDLKPMNTEDMEIANVES